MKTQIWRAPNYRWEPHWHIFVWLDFESLSCSSTSHDQLESEFTFWNSGLPIAGIFLPCFLLSSSTMNFYYSFLLLLVVLSAYSESPPYTKSPDSTIATVCPNNHTSLGVLAPVLPQNEVYMSILPQIGMSQTEVNITVLPENEVFQIVAVNFQLSSRVKTIIKFVINSGVRRFKILPSTLIHCGEKLCWTIRILLESFRYVLEMYTWSLSENQASVQFKSRLIGLLLKRSLFQKHDFAVLVHSVYHDYQNLHFWDLKFFPKYKISTCTHIIEEQTEKSSTYQFHGGGKALLFSFDELFPYASTDLHEQQYQFLQGVKKKNRSTVLFLMMMKYYV